MNLFSYCNNNPVMYYDPSGHSAILAILIAVGILAIDTIIETAILMNSDKYKFENVYHFTYLKIMRCSINILPFSRHCLICFFCAHCNRLIVNYIPYFFRAYSISIEGVLTRTGKYVSPYISLAFTASSNFSTSSLVTVRGSSCFGFVFDGCA